MNYNDFPILSNDAYKILKTHYQATETIKPDRNSLLIKINCLLQECKSLCLGTSIKISKDLQYELTKANLNISTVLDNLSTISTNSNNQLKEIKDFNLFSFLKKIFKSILLISEWHENEDKEYYKSILHSCIKLLGETLSSILNLLENKNIIMFKYM